MVYNFHFAYGNDLLGSSWNHINLQDKMNNCCWQPYTVPYLTPGFLLAQ